MYLFSYFKTAKEALFLAVSKDGYNWVEINDGQPVFETTLGNKSIRDPFIFQDNNRLFHLLSTNSWWNQSIIHAVSDDLIHWSGQKEWPFMEKVEHTKNMWAPEAIFDKKTGSYYIYWSSTVDSAKDKCEDNRIWFVKTKDFKLFTDPGMLMDFGFNIIDATIHAHDDKYIIALKDERCSIINVYLSAGIEEEYRLVNKVCEQTLIEGPTIYKVKDKFVMLYDFFTEDEHYGASESVDGIHWNSISDKFNLPFKARHGSVMQIPDNIFGEYTFF